MEEKIKDELRCPECKLKVNITEKKKDDKGFIKSGKIVCEKCKKEYTLINYIPRFVPRENYAKNFGFEWLKHSRIQIDKFTGMTLSKERFCKQTEWTEKELKNKKILEAGCGGGRFTQIILDAKAKVYSFDYSAAVDANQKNNGIKKEFNLFQADIYKIPFPEKSFDFIFCFGVLQHTPNPEKSFKNLVKYLKSSGKIAIDIYPKTIKNLLHPRYSLRFFTKNMKYSKLYWLIEKFLVPVLLPLSEALRKIPFTKGKLRNLVPVENVKGVLPTKNEKLLREWAVLNTFDWLSPEYDKPRSLKTIKRWFKEADLRNIDVYLDSNIIVGTAEK